MADEPPKVGDEVRIIEGVLAGSTGVIVSPGHDLSEGWLAIRLTLLGKTTVVEMHSEFVEKV